jgi:hypothetical protein
MKTTFMDKMQAQLEKNKGKKLIPVLIYTAIFTFMAFTVLLKFAGNILPINKSKLK